MTDPCLPKDAISDASAYRRPSSTSVPKVDSLRASVLGLLACSLHVSPSHGQQIWFSPRSAPAYAEEFHGLFKPDAPWKKAASHVAAFELSIQLETQASDEQLKEVIDGLRAKHIALALDMLPLTGRGNRIAPSGCGFQVEGYASAMQSLAVAKRFRSLGADVTYFDMDEPLYFGHFFEGTNACRTSLGDLMADVSQKIRQVSAQYPNAQFGEAEPIVAITRSGLVDLEHWLDTFQSATGKPLAFLRLDIDWKAPWQGPVAEVARLLKRKGVRLQVIYNGSPRDTSDAAWISHAFGNAMAFETITTPDDVVIQSWDTYPKRFLPETDATTMTGLIDSYVGVHHFPN